MMQVQRTKEPATYSVAARLTETEHKRLLLLTEKYNTTISEIIRSLLRDAQ